MEKKTAAGSEVYETLDIRRGEIYYISGDGKTKGHEQRADRPAVIVSNDRMNKTSGTVEVVYLTTKPKTDLQTHCTIRSTKRASTALCEQITTVSKERLQRYICTCTATEKKNIEICLMISLELNSRNETAANEAELVRVTAERDTYKDMYMELLKRLEDSRIV